MQITCYFLHLTEVKKTMTSSDHRAGPAGRGPRRDNVREADVLNEAVDVVVNSFAKNTHGQSSRG